MVKTVVGFSSTVKPNVDACMLPGPGSCEDKRRMHDKQGANVVGLNVAGVHTGVSAQENRLSVAAILKSRKVLDYGRARGVRETLS